MSVNELDPVEEYVRRSGASRQPHCQRTAPGNVLAVGGALRGFVDVRLECTASGEWSPDLNADGFGRVIASESHVWITIYK